MPPACGSAGIRQEWPDAVGAQGAEPESPLPRSLLTCRWREVDLNRWSHLHARQNAELALMSVNQHRTGTPADSTQVFDIGYEKDALVGSQSAPIGTPPPEKLQ